MADSRPGLGSAQGETGTSCYTKSKEVVKDSELHQKVL